MRATPTFASLLLLTAAADAATTWPAATDEIEELMTQLYGTNARSFAAKITPCSNEASGPGRQNAAEWLRVAFHDMATASPYFGTGGIDASLAFELNDGENTGPGHNTTLQTYAAFFSPRASMSDLIALGTYASVRVCGGPIIPLKGGRIDATSAGSPGVPQPQNTIGTFTSQFNRMGYNASEMIQFTACGHTLGGVHNPEFPVLVPAGTTANGEAALDTTESKFDNAVVTEYLDGTTKNPLVVGPSVAAKQNSDFVVFNSDGNVTMNGLRDPTFFQNICKTLFQRMIEIVPAGVTLSAPITVYTVKPVNLQLALNADGSALNWSGSIRVRTNGFTQSIPTVTLNYVDRNGAASSSTTASLQGTGNGFDDDFNYYTISADIPTSSGISAFTVTLNFADGTTQVFDNNGNKFPVSDAVIFQPPQSCLTSSTGALTVGAFIRNDRATLATNLTVHYQTARAKGNPLPNLLTASVPMTKGDCVGDYTFYSASYTITGGLSPVARLDVVSGSGSESVINGFNAASALSSTCTTYTGSATCGGVVVSSSSAASSASSSSTGSPSSTTLATSTVSSSSSVFSSTSSSASPIATLAHKPQVVGYNLVGCWTEGTGTRALSGASFAYDAMTLESCASNCTGFAWFAAEYGRECYCGSSLAASSKSASLSECNMVCGGNPYEYCGAGNRLELYLTSTSSLPSGTATSATLSTSTVSSAAPTGTLAVKPTVGKYSFVSCWTEGTGSRALSADSYADDGMTLETCAAFCSSYTMFATEYGRECYCGNTLADSSAAAPLSDCSFTCSGNPFEYCGAGNRLELYSLAPASSTTRSSSTGVVSRDVSSTISSTISSTSSTYSSPPVVSTPSSSASTSSVTSPISSSAIDSSSTSSTTSPASTTSSPISSSTSIPISSSTVATLAHKPTVSPYSFVGCWTEGTGTRALSAASYSNNTAMTLESCAAFCSPYAMFATEFGAECYCGNTLASSSSPAPLSDCSMVCSGSSIEYCGAGNRLELYQNNSTTIVNPSQPATVGGYKWYGCQTEATGGRALSATSFASDSMTLESCQTFCQGYEKFGVEYSRECYCGNSFNDGSVEASSADCSMTCSGNDKEYCGGPDRLSTYTSV